LQIIEKKGKGGRGGGLRRGTFHIYLIRSERRKKKEGETEKQSTEPACANSSILGNPRKKRKGGDKKKE